MKKVCLFVLSMFIGLSTLNAINQTTESTIVEDLKCFYTRLDKESLYILDTNKFMCSSSGCTSSIFEKAGIISTYEYKNIGGNSSYLVSREPFVTLNNTGYDLATSTEIINNEGNGALKPNMYLKEDVKVRGSGTKRDPWILVPLVKSVNLYASINGGELTSDFPSNTSTYLYDGYYCDKDVNISISEDIYNENIDKINVSSIYENKKCVFKYKSGYKVTLKFTNNIIEDKYIVVGSSLSNKIEKPTNSDYTWEEADISCEEGINVTVDEEYIKATDIRKDGTCTITLKELPVIGLSVKNGSISNGASNKRVSYIGEDITFTVTPNSGYKIEGSSITCNNGSTPVISGNLVKFNNVTKSDVCVLNMAVDKLRVTLNVVNGSSDASYKETNLNGSVSFTITPGSEYDLTLTSDTCNGTFSGNIYTVSNVTSNKTCTITLKHKIYTWAKYKYVTKTIPAQATTVTTSLPEGTMILDEEYDSQVNVTGFVAFDSFTAGTDGYFTIPSDYEDFSPYTYKDATETVPRRYFAISSNGRWITEIYSGTTLVIDMYEECCRACDCDHKSRFYLKGSPKKYTISYTPETTTSTKEFVENVTSENKSAYPTDGDMNGYYYKLIS